MKKIIINCLLALTFLFGACSPPVQLKFDGTNYYQVVNHQFVAFDGTNWFQMRKGDQSFGEMSGVALGQNEEWVKLTGDGSHVSPYHRTLDSGNDTNIPPRFVR